MESADNTRFDSDNSTSSQSSALYREPITRAAAAIILLSAPVLFAAPIILAGHSLTPRADMDGTLGLHLVIGRDIAEGVLPFLNPYLLSAPLLFATIHAGALYPPSWLFALFSPTTSTDIFVITSFYIALAGLYLFGRRTGMTRLGSISSSAAFTFGVLGGLTAAGIGDSSSIASAAWIPWILLAIESFAQKARPRWVLLGGMFLALQVFAGDMQIGLLTALTAFAYVVFRNKRGDRDNPFLLGAVIMLTGGVLLTMIQLVPIKENFISGNANVMVGESLPTSGMFPMRIPLLAYLWLSAAVAVIVCLRSKIGDKSPTIFWATTAAITLSIASLTPETLERTLYWAPIYGLFRSSAIPLFICGFTVAVLMGSAISRLPDLRNSALLRPVAGIILLAAIPMILAFSANLTSDRSRAEIYSRLQDPPAVQLIKSREKDLNSFRVLRQDAAPDQQGKRSGTDSTRAITPGLRYVNGARESAPPRIAAIAGDLNENGEVTNREIFGPSYQGLDLLGVKYVLVENEPNKGAPAVATDMMEIDGVKFLKDDMQLRLSPGSRLDFAVPATTASEFVFLSTMGGSTDVADGATIGAVKFHTKDGRILTQEIQAGRDTAEWSYDNPGLLNKIKHKKARVAESFPDKGFSCHVYIGRLPFERAEVTRIEIDRSEQADFLITRMALYDDATQKSNPLTREDVMTHHLREIDRLGNVTVYQNDNYRPPAFFVKRVALESSSEVLNSIKTGRLPDNSKFDVSGTALLEGKYLRAQKLNIPPVDNAAESSVTISSQSPGGMEMATQNKEAGFLVVNLPYHRGWTAFIDGNQQPVERADFALMGIAVPAGTHRINLTFNLLKVGQGVSYFILGLLVLALAPVAFRLRHRNILGLSPDLINRMRLAGSGFVRQYKLLIASTEGYKRKIGSSKLPMIIGMAGLIIYGSMMIWRAGYGIGGSDSYGYGNLAKTLAQFKATATVKELAEFDLSQDYIAPFLPLAYIQGPKPATMSTIYSMGLPLEAAAAAAIFGWDIGPFLVSPLSATLAILLMYLIGLEFGLSKKLSAVGGVLLGLFPTTVSQGLVLMSDAPAMFWSIAAVLAALRSRKNPHWAIAAGFAFGMSVLMRPPSALMLLPIVFALPISIKSLIRFGLGGLPAAALLSLYNWGAFGSPFEGGYSSIGIYGFFQVATFRSHISQYIYWISILMSPAVLFFWAATAVNKSVRWRDRAVIISWFAGPFIFYCAYGIVYDYDASWEYTRFLLPAIPALILGFLLTTQYISDLFTAPTDNGYNRATNIFVVLLLLLPVLATSASRIHRYDIYHLGAGVEEYKKAAQWAGAIIPQKSLVVSVGYSGTMKYYTDRPTLRYDALTPELWSVVKDHVKEKGYQLYALLMPYERSIAPPKIPGKWTLIDTYNGHTTLWKIDPE
jgi:4-amino-4-deoxy-L-arabinose transferase-like glycosyltransferase